MLEDLVERGIIELLPPKQLEEVGRTTDLKYCHYHRVISHPLKQCITLKKCIMQLARDGKITWDLDDSIGTNHISFQVEHYPLSSQQSHNQLYDQGKANGFPPN